MDELRITAPDDADGAQLIALQEWLSDSVRLRGVPVSVHRAGAEPEDMTGSGVVDAVVAVVTDKATVTGVTTAVAGWLVARMSARRTKLRIRRGDREIEVDTAQKRDLDELAAWMNEQLGGSEGEGDHPSES
jgi:hypothetical protein